MAGPSLKEPSLVGSDMVSSLVEEAENLPSGVLPPRLLVVHDAIAGGQNNMAEPAFRKPGRKSFGTQAVFMPTQEVAT